MTKPEPKPFSRLFRAGNNAKRDAATRAPVIDVSAAPSTELVAKVTGRKAKPAKVARAPQPHPSKAKPAPKAKKSAARINKAKAPATKAEQKPTSSVVKFAFKERARKTGGVLRNDRIGTAIRNWFLAQDSKKSAMEQGRLAVDALLKANQLEVGRWAGRNVGMLRMNVTNVARAMLRNGEGFTVDGKAFNKAGLDLLAAE